MSMNDDFYYAYTILKSGNGMDISDGRSTWYLSYEGVVFIFSKDISGTYTIESLKGIGYHCIDMNDWCDSRGIDVEQLTLEDFQVMLFETRVVGYG